MPFFEDIPVLGQTKLLSEKFYLKMNLKPLIFH